MATRKRTLTAKEEIAEARRRAKGARTPIAKAVTKQVLDATKRAHSGQVARGADAKARRAVQSYAARGSQRRGLPGEGRTASKTSRR
jgi:uncharacterized membrane protein